MNLNDSFYLNAIMLLLLKIPLLLVYVPTQSHVKRLKTLSFLFSAYVLSESSVCPYVTTSLRQCSTVIAFAGTSAVCEENLLPTSVWEVVCVGKVLLYLTGK